MLNVIALIAMSLINVFSVPPPAPPQDAAADQTQCAAPARDGVAMPDWCASVAAGD